MINRFHMEQFAYFVEKLRTTQESDGAGSVLENSMIVYGSGISDGNAHSHHDLPVVLAGGGRGTLKAGRHVRYAKDTPMSNLYLSLLERVGVEPGRFGDSAGKLANLS
jgi:hypothetical protein